MTYLENIKDLDDFRVANREAFRMEQVYKFNLDNYIAEYDYDLCEKNSDDEDSEEEESKGVKEGASAAMPKNGNPHKETTQLLNTDYKSWTNFIFQKDHSQQNSETSDSINPFEMNMHSRSNGSTNSKLPKAIKEALDGFSMRMAKTKSFHAKLSSQKLL